MNLAGTRREEVFRVRCVHIGRDACLYKDTWHYKIVKDHAEVRSKIGFIKDTLEKQNSAITKFRKKRNHEEIAIFRECQDFMPYYRYLKIGLKILDANLAVVTTVHGQHSAPPKDMEPI